MVNVQTIFYVEKRILLRQLFKSLKLCHKIENFMLQILGLRFK